MATRNAKKRGSAPLESVPELDESDPSPLVSKKAAQPKTEEPAKESSAAEEVEEEDLESSGDEIDPNDPYASQLRYIK